MALAALQWGEFWKITGLFFVLGIALGAIGVGLAFLLGLARVIP